uniref:Reverse transcriptase domain-containing protein n=1 Tax=Plectus sambesii TaxID=2011161 RepID=A0A914W1W0_9BILA
MAVKIGLLEGLMVIISAYAPQVGCAAEEKEAFWESLNTTLPSFQDVKHLIIGGDLNGHVGAARDGYKAVHGGCGFGARNPEGGAVLDAAVAYDLAIANTFFQKRDKHIITFKSGSACTQIDYLLLLCSTLGDVKNCKVIPGDALSIKSRRQKLSPKVKWWECNKQNRALFKQAMTPQLTNTLNINASTNDMWQPTATALLTTARELLGSTRGGTRPNKETWWWNADVQEAVHKKKIVKTIKDSNGTALRRENKIRERWGEYFHTLLNEENAQDACDETPPVSGPIHAITKAEVNLALWRMKNGKAVGPDGIPTEAWKACGNTGVTWLTVLFNRILESGKMPDAWRSSTITPIYKKKGDVQQCSNYRGIKLLSHTMKLWERVIDARLRAASEVAPNQFSFTPGCSTTDAIFALRILTEKHCEKRQPLHFAFIDMEKAYDRVPRELIWWALRKKRIPEQYVHIIQDMYSKAQAAVQTCYGKAAAFPVTVGVHQGSALSPYLFITVLDVIGEDLLEPAPWTMLYADDIVLCSRDQRDLERKLQKWKD